MQNLSTEVGRTWTPAWLARRFAGLDGWLARQQACWPADDVCCQTAVPEIASCLSIFCCLYCFFLDAHFLQQWAGSTAVDSGKGPEEKSSNPLDWQRGPHNPVATPGGARPQHGKGWGEERLGRKRSTSQPGGLGARGQTAPRSRREHRPAQSAGWVKALKFQILSSWIGGCWGRKPGSRAATASTMRRVDTMLRWPRPCGGGASDRLQIEPDWSENAVNLTRSIWVKRAPPLGFEDGFTQYTLRL